MNIFFKSKKLFFIIILSLIISGTIIIFLPSNADEVYVELEIFNNAPVIESVFLSNTANQLQDDYADGYIIPNQGAIRTLYVNGVVRDSDGESDISTTSLVFYRSGVDLGLDCIADNNNCYRNDFCSLSPDTSDSKIYSCQINLEYYVDATDNSGRFPDEHWIVYVQASDLTGLINQNADITKEVNTVLALNIPDTIDYGNLGPGYETTAVDNVEFNIIQEGNDEGDVELYGQVLTCNVGTIPINNQAWALADVGYTLSTPLTDTPINVELGMPYRNNDTEETSMPIYWNIKIPTNDVSGSCSGSIHVIVIASDSMSGFLMDRELVNIDYESFSYNGTTDSRGRFFYNLSEDITFKIGDTTLGSISSVSEDGYVFLPNLLGLDKRDTDDVGVIKLARLLQSLDMDASLSNGITIDEADKATMPNTIDITQFSDSALEDIVSSTGKVFISAQEAQDHLEQTLSEIVGISLHEESFLFASAEGYIQQDAVLGTSFQDNHVQLVGSFLSGGNDLNTKLLIHSNNNDGETNFLDDSMTAHIITPNADVMHSVNQSHFGSSAMHFDGTDDYLEVTAHSDFMLGTDDFTIDFWLMSSDITEKTNLVTFGSVGSTEFASIGYDRKKIYWYSNYNGSDIEIKTDRVINSSNTWYHITVERYNGNIRIFLDGFLLESGTDNNNYNTLVPVLIGKGKENNYVDFTGYLDEVRISSNARLYDENDPLYGNGVDAFTTPGEAYIQGGEDYYSTAASYYVTTGDATNATTSYWLDIESINIIQNTPTDTSILYLVSFDNRTTWKYFDGLDWQITSLANLQSVGMNKTALESINSDDWNKSGAFIQGVTEHLDFALDLKTDSEAFTPNLSEIKVNYNAYNETN